jgi:protein-disulfide isomerase
VAQSKRKGQPAGRGSGGVGGSQTAFYVVLGVIALVGIGAIFYAVRGGSGGGDAAMEPVAVDFADSRELYERATPKRIGSDDAPVKIVVFSDFMCGGCAAFSLRERPKIMPWIERGEAQYIAYDFPLGGRFVHGFIASRAARCAGDQPMDGTVDGTAYWPYQDRLYSYQASWSGQRDVLDTFVGYAGEIGLDQRAFEQCLRSDRHADVVTANRMVGDQLGVNSTPTVLVNNRRVSGQTIDQMGDQVIRILQETAGPATAGSR